MSLGGADDKISAKTRKRRTWDRNKTKTQGDLGAQPADGMDTTEVLYAFLLEKEKSALKAWFKYFDQNQNGRVSEEEFRDGMSRLRYAGSVEGLWADMDPESSGEITLDEICAQEAQLWNQFRKFCGTSFDNPRDMISRMKQAANAKVCHGEEHLIRANEFVTGLRGCGWQQVQELLLFEALDQRSEGVIGPRDLKWLEVEVHRNKQKQEARQKSVGLSGRKQAASRMSQAALNDFKAFLRHSFGPIYHGWRRCLDADGSMTVTRADLFKVCRVINWKGDVRALWKALDFDLSGITTLEELDPQCAQLLAHFKTWAEGQFGPKPSAMLWKAFDRQRKRKLSHQQFANECKAHGFENQLKTLSGWLDWRNQKFIEIEDLGFLDTWRPPPWLVAKPNPDAADQLRRLLKQKYGHSLKAWRAVMDKDNSNSCNWHEFTDAAKHIKFPGDVAGAWLALDEDLSGFISLNEIDRNANSALVEFRQWAVEEFGSVAMAFKMLDTDHSNELTYTEFRFAVRNYGFAGDLPVLFENLDQGRSQRLEFREVAFLDGWQVPQDDLPAGMSNDCTDATWTMSQSQDPISAGESLLPDFWTSGPGPGAYDMSSGFGAMPWAPCAKHGGAFSFNRRGEWLKVAKSIGPAHYDLAPEKVDEVQKRRKPAWSFGSQARPAAIRAVSTPPMRASPGPGAYEAKTSFNGPLFSMGTRRGGRLHPLQRPCSQRSDRSHSYK